MKRKKAEDMLDLFHDRQDVEEKYLYPTWGRVPRDHGSRRGPMAQGSIWLTVAQADFGRPPTSDIIYVYRRLRLRLRAFWFCFSTRDPDASGQALAVRGYSSHIP